MKAIISFILLLPFSLFAQDIQNDSLTFNKIEVKSLDSINNGWEEKAKKDISEGKIILIAVASYQSCVNIDSLESLFAKYGFTATHLGCIRPSPGYEKYNEVVIKFLESRNGQDWYSRYLIEYNELMKSAIYYVD